MGIESSTTEREVVTLVNTNIKDRQINDTVFRAFIYGQFIGDVKYYFYEPTPGKGLCLTFAFANGQDASIFVLKGMESALTDFLTKGTA